MTLQEECKQYRGMQLEAALLKQQLWEMDKSLLDDPEQQERIRQRVKQLAQHCANVEAAIAAAPDAMIRAAMMMHYQRGMKWPEVALNCGGDMLPDAIRKRVSCYLGNR